MGDMLSCHSERVRRDIAVRDIVQHQGGNSDVVP